MLVVAVKTTFESYFGQPKGQRILIVGCGLSTIASEIHALGYRCITAMDISPTAITLMQAGEQDKEGVECEGILTVLLHTNCNPAAGVYRRRCAGLGLLALAR